jgi:uncharacterized membrane protein YedE/YeeE
MNRMTPSAPRDPVAQAMARIDPVAFGLSVGALAGPLVFLATAWLLIKGGDPVGPRLALLGQYFIGYTVSWPGSLVGFGYGLAGGFALGWLIAVLHNLVITITLLFLQARGNLTRVTDYLDPDHSE